MMQTQIPDGLQALMQASQILSTQASPTAPGPQGPQPTVAERVNQQIQQTVRPAQQPQQPQQGIMGMPPNLREIGQQAGIGGQIMAQKAAQQQQMAQNPQAVAQMAAQMLQNQGVASLPSNLQFKEGGIIGFDGEDESYVPEVSVPGMEELKRILAESQGVQVAGDNQTAIQALEDARQKLIAANQSGDPQSAQFYAKKVADLQKQVVAEAPVQAAPVTTRGSFTPRQEPVATSQPRAVSADTTPGLVETTKARLRDIANILPAGLPSGSGIEMLRAAFADKQEPPAAPKAAQPRPAAPTISPEAADAALVTPPSRAARVAVPTAKPVDQGIVQALPPRAAAPVRAPAPAVGATPENIAARRAGILSGAAEPTTQSVVAAAEKIAPPTAEKTISELQKIEDERARLKASMGDLNEEGIAALRQEQAARKQLLSSKAERDQFNRVQAFFRDLYTRGDTYGTVQAGIFAREEADRLADLASSKAIIELKKAQQADKLGDVDRKAAAIEKYNELRNKETQYRVQAAQIAAKIQGDVYQTQGQAGATAASTLSQEKIEFDRLRERHTELALKAKELGQLRESQLLNAAFGKLDTATKNRDKIYEETKGSIAFKDSKDPAGQQMYKDAQDRRAVADKTHAEATRVYDSIADKVLKETSGAAKPSTTGKKPDFVYENGKLVPNK